MRKEQISKRLIVKIASLLVFVCCLLLAALFRSPVQASYQGAPPTTVILVRHAEKQVVPPENKDPDLSLAGEARAQEIARMFKDANIAELYVTQYKRTQQTVKPLAEQIKVPVTKIEAKQTENLVARIREHNAGQTVLVAGHNNTIPEIIAALGGPTLPIIPESEFDHLFILTIQKDGVTKLLRLTYGNHQPTAGQSMMKP